MKKKRKTKKLNEKYLKNVKKLRDNNYECQGKG